MPDWQRKVVEWRTRIVENPEFGGGRNPKRPIVMKIPHRWEITCPAGHSSVIRGKKSRGGYRLICPTCGDFEEVSWVAVQSP